MTTLFRMMWRQGFAKTAGVIAALGALSVEALSAQQVPDTVFRSVTTTAAFPAGAGPRIGIDEAHHNFHTAVGRYRPFAMLAERNGYRVVRVNGTLSDARLSAIDVLVIANPLNAVNAPNNWTLPTPSAYSADEIAAVQRFVERGGALLLIADHMPFAGAAEALGTAFGIRFYNGFSQMPDSTSLFVLRRSDNLLSHAITNGRSAGERIDSVMVFTGSALSVSLPASRGTATPLMKIPAGARVSMPTTAWQFTASTPTIAADSLLFGAALTVGKGRVVAAGEAAMFSAQRAGPQAANLMGFNNPSAHQNGQFVLNVLRWLTEER